MFLCRMEQHFTYWIYLIIHGPWGLNFGGMMLSQLNLIKVKKGTLPSLFPHQNLLVRSNLPWEIGNPREG